MYTLRVKDHFDAAHYIKNYAGKCSREHGHRWDVEVCLGGIQLNKLNMLVDFVEVKDAMGNIMGAHLDHYQLNETLGEENLTAEYLAEWFYRQMKARLTVKRRSTGLDVMSVTIWESPDCSITYKE